MDTFGKKMASLRKEKKVSQQVLAKLLNTSTSVIGRYERDEMTPSIDAAKKIAKILETTVGYLLGETENDILFKDPEMLKRFKNIDKLNDKEKEHILFAIDAMLRDTMTSRAYAK